MVVIKEVYNKQRGASLLWVTVFAGVMSLIVANMLTLIMAETKYTVNSDLSYKAYVAAQSGIESTLLRLRQDISAHGMFYLKGKDPSAYTMNYTLSAEDATGLDNVFFSTQVVFDFSGAREFEPKITVTSTGTAEGGGKTSRRKVVYVNDYSASVGAENFEVAGTNYAQVVDKLRGALRATLLIENARKKPNFHISFLPNGSIPGGDYKIHLGNPGAGVGTNKIDYPTGFDVGEQPQGGNNKKTRWRLDYIGPSGVYVSLEERLDQIGFDGKKFSKWECRRGQFFDLPSGQATLSNSKLKTGALSGNNGPVARQDIFDIGGGTWQVVKEPFSNNHWLYNSSQDAAIDNVVAIRY